MSIKYVKNHDINYFRWDRCISSSFNSLVYAYTWYLNTVCPRWDALIEDDYSAVMPLPLSRKYGINGIQTPCFTGQLGIFSSKLITSDKINDFFKALPPNFKFVDITINKFNKIDSGRLNKSEKIHFEIDLIKAYEKINNSYSAELKEKLNICKKNKLTFIRGLQPADLIDFLSVSKQQPKNYCNEDNTKVLRMLINASLRYRFGELFGIYNKYNQLCCAGFFIWSQNRSILLFYVISEEGKAENAFTFLIDRYIYTYNNRYITLTFDFTADDSHVSILKEFGAIESRFQRITLNKIPLLSFILNRSK